MPAAESADLIQKSSDILCEFFLNLFLPLHLLSALTLAAEEEELMGFV